jgi:hypothetical protein
VFLGDEPEHIESGGGEGRYLGACALHGVRKFSGRFAEMDFMEMKKKRTRVHVRRFTYACSFTPFHFFERVVFGKKRF